MFATYLANLAPFVFVVIKLTTKPPMIPSNCLVGHNKIEKYLDFTYNESSKHNEKEPNKCNEHVIAGNLL